MNKQLNVQFVASPINFMLLWQQIKQRVPNVGKKQQGRLTKPITGGGTIMSSPRLYRGKRVDTCKWTQGWYRQFNSVINGKKVLQHYISDNDIEGYEVIPETVGQWTGEAMNDLKVFEGDIFWSDRHGAYGVVEFMDAEFVFRCENEICSLVDMLPLEYHGNIHDNTNILED